MAFTRRRWRTQKRGRIRAGLDGLAQPSVVPVNASASAAVSFLGSRLAFSHQKLHQTMLLSVRRLEGSMRTTVTLDDELLAKAVKLTGGLDRLNSTA